MFISYTKEYKHRKHKEYIQKNRDFINLYKSHCRCLVCSESHIRCLEFHHIDPTKKRWAVADSVTHDSLKRLKEEIRKCVVLCANCHCKVHNNLIKLNDYLDRHILIENLLI